VILDLGCGENPRGNINLDVTRTPYCNLVASAEQLPIKSLSIDKVLCSQVLEHLSDPALALKEINRVLKPNGIAEIDVPKPFFTSNSRHRLFELLLNSVFIFMPMFGPAYIRRLVVSLRGIRKKDSRWFHRYIVTADFIGKFLEVTNVTEFGDFFLKPLTSGRKAKYFRGKPKINTKVLVKCTKHEK